MTTPDHIPPRDPDPLLFRAVGLVGKAGLLAIFAGILFLLFDAFWHGVVLGIY